MHYLTEKEERRFVADRREKPTTLGIYTLRGGRRRTVRRKTDKRKYICLDVYSTQLWITLLSLMILSLIDAYLTLFLIENDLVVEANPIMAFYAGYGNVSFVMMKTAITSASLFIFCLCHGFTSAKIFLLLSIVIYFFIIMYELNIVYKV
jgi:hypothetical protein